MVEGRNLELYLLKEKSNGNVTFINATPKYILAEDEEMALAMRDELVKKNPDKAYSSLKHLKTLKGEVFLSRNLELLRE